MVTTMAYNDLTFIDPRASASTSLRACWITRISPAVPEADALYATCLSYRIDPAVALAFFAHESSCGTAGRRAKR